MRSNFVVLSFQGLFGRADCRLMLCNRWGLIALRGSVDAVDSLSGEANKEWKRSGRMSDSLLGLVSW